MEKSISAANANRSFSKLLRGVRDGHTYVVTSHGRPIARIGPVEKNGNATRAARATLLKRLRTETTVNIGRWTRDELYEDKA